MKSPFERAFVTSNGAAMFTSVPDPEAMMEKIRVNVKEPGMREA